jgi:hypothetical protein
LLAACRRLVMLLSSSTPARLGVARRKLIGWNKCDSTASTSTPPYGSFGPASRPFYYRKESVRISNKVKFYHKFSVPTTLLDFH